MHRLTRTSTPHLSTPTRPILASAACLPARVRTPSRHAPTIGLLLLLAAATAIVGCEPKGDARVKYTIALAGPSDQHPAWPAVRAGALSFVNESPSIRGTTYQAPADTAQGQKTLCDQLLAATDIDAVVFWSTHPAQAAKAVELLVGRGVPVVLVGVDMPDTARTAYVGWDQQAVGEALVALAAQHVKPRQTIMVLHAGTEQPQYNARWTGVQTGLQLHPELESLAEIDCLGWPQVARERIAEKMARYPNLSGWISLGDWPLRGLHDPTTLLPPSCMLITCHPAPAYWPLLTSPGRAAFIAGDYFEWGRQAVGLILTALGRNPIGRSVQYKPAEPITAENLDQWRARWQNWMAGRRSPDITPSRSSN